MKRFTCDYENGKRCRRGAIVAISYLEPFGTQVSMTGPEKPTYLQRIALRCDDHSTIDREQGRMPIATYQAAIVQG